MSIEQAVEEFIRDTKKEFVEVARQQEENAKRFKETDKQFKETDKKFNKLEGFFSTQWGKLMEALVEPSVLRLFQEIGINITRTSKNIKAVKQGRNMEIDILAVDEDYVILVEVKTTLKVDYINEHLSRLKDFLFFYPEYKDKQVLGCVAYITADEDCSRYAYKKGLFVLSLSGEGIIELKNDKNFKPTNFNPKH